MPITSMYLTEFAERDRHVLKGQSSPDLTVAAVRFESAAGVQSARDYLGSNADVSLTFTPLFKGVPNGNVLSISGISFDTTTGVCTVAPDAGSLTKPNFIVEVVAAPRPGSPGQTFTEVIRFHVHSFVARVWLTPDPLTVRPVRATKPEWTEYSFAVRARYDDDTVGDISMLHGVTWEELEGGTWQPATHVGIDGHIILRVADSPGQQITLRAIYPTPAGPAVGEGKVNVGQSWADEPNPTIASIVPGGGWPGTISPEKVPNVLFLPDGFTPADQGSFNNITESFVNHMKKDRMMRPFDLLAASINFWRTFPGGPRGISLKNELYRSVEDGKTYVEVLPLQVKPVSGKPWNISHMTYAVGLPLPSDKTRGDEALRTSWALQLKDDPSPHLNVDLIRQWKALADRVFALEVDSFPGLSYGQPPAARATDNNLLGMHEGRGGLRVLRSFCRRIVSDSGVALSDGASIGKLWGARDIDNVKVAATSNLNVSSPGPSIDGIEMSPGDWFLATAQTSVSGNGTWVWNGEAVPATRPPGFDPEGNVARGYLVEASEGPGAGFWLLTTSAPRFVKVSFDNRDFIAIVTAIPGGRAVNREGYMALGTENGSVQFEVIEDHPTLRAVKLKFGYMANDASKDSSRTMCHELAHSFGLADEYADIPGAYPYQSDPLTLRGNVQTAQNVKNSAGRFAGDLIKWNWHRIKKAGVIDGQITGPVAGPYTIPLQLGHGLPFAVHDKILLRLRRPGRPLTAAPTVLSSAQELSVVSSTTEAVVVQPVTAGAVTLAQLQRFVPGSILFCPTPAPNSVRSAAYPYAEIVSKNVKDTITNDNRPLWAHPADDQSRGPDVQPPNLDNIDLPGLDWCFKNKPRIVGLYEGGISHARGIFHPAGTCMMGNSRDEAAEFCHVCRYLIVDIVDPRRHFQIDIDYEKVYAQG